MTITKTAGIAPANSMATNDYIDPDWKEILAANGLATFDQLWTLDVVWFEPPNTDRGGFSGVARLTLKTADGGARAVFLKRQRNHCRRPVFTPWVKEPTFAREFSMLRHLKQKHVDVPTPVFFGQRTNGSEVCAIIVTEALEGYQSLDSLMLEIESGAKRISPAAKRNLITAVAKTIADLHLAGVQHRSLYPKHIFIKERAPASYEAALIDFEKSRRSHFPFLTRIQDLATLNYRSQGWTKAQRMRFFSSYHHADRRPLMLRMELKLLLHKSRTKSTRLRTTDAQH